MIRMSVHDSPSKNENISTEIYMIYIVQQLESYLNE